MMDYFSFFELSSKDLFGNYAVLVSSTQFFIRLAFAAAF
jgi:hypothetical protein